MSRGPDGNRPRDIASARRKGSRRTAAARVRQEQRRRLRAIERKHTKRFLRLAVAVARKTARNSGWQVKVERKDGASGRRSLLRWNEAAVDLVPTEISVRFSLADKRVSGSSNAIGVYSGRKVVRLCPEHVLQSAEGRAFAAWLGDSLAAAAERVSGSRK